MAELRDWGRHRNQWIDLLQRQTGQDLAIWNARVAEAAPADETTLRAWLTVQGVSGYARMLLVMERFGYPDYLTATGEALVDAQYADRPALRPVYEALVGAALEQGDVTVQARKTYVSLLTPKRTFARIHAATRLRIDVGLRLEDTNPVGRLAPSRIHETMPVQISLQTLDDLDEEARGWLRTAYERNC